MTSEDDNDASVKFAFERESVVVALTQLVPLKSLRPGIKESRKYPANYSLYPRHGLVEAPVVTPDPKRPGTYLLLDGLLRIEALKDLGIAEVECLVSTDDEAYTYNKRINRLAAVQEQRMIARAEPLPWSTLLRRPRPLSRERPARRHRRGIARRVDAHTVRTPERGLQALSQRRRRRADSIAAPTATRRVQIPTNIRCPTIATFCWGFGRCLLRADSARPAFRPTRAIRARDQQRQLNVDSVEKLRNRATTKISYLRAKHHLCRWSTR